MVDLLGLLVAILLIFLSFNWLKRQQKSTAGTQRGIVIERVDAEAEEEEESKQSMERNLNKPKIKSQRATTKKNKNKHQIPSDPRFLRRYGGHAGAVTAFSASPDGQWLATAGTDGQIRVAKVDEASFNLSATVKTPGMGVFQDHLSAISWLSSEGNPTVAGTIEKSRQIAFYRVRLRKNATTTPATTGGTAKASNNSNQYELIELVKRRFNISSKVDEGVRVAACLADHSHDSNKNCLILTKTVYDPKQSQMKHPNTVAWSGDGGDGAAGTVNTNSPGLRMSPDGAFLCGRGGIGSSEAKIFEVRRRKVKGESEPVFDSVSSRSVMTLVPRTTAAKVADVAFCGERDNLKLHHVSLGVVACEDGSVEVWNLDVDFRQREDPGFICSVQVLDGGDEPVGSYEKKVVCMASSNAISSPENNATIYRLAVATSDSALHLLSYHIEKAHLSVDFSILNSGHKEGVGELQFCPFSGNILYSTGNNNSRDVYSWNLS
mmetsp:Transcript_52351/g.111250  ORF Transcript_52351/g.111250 Transcript_52351/m.111250 type:complete len:492 (+) Transcript_52351:134-1609(+)|eukprot:CAMPEP_0172536954 /NCGR_PEP_ID=MMETSP1067-20121228/8654_1 /TAXON_ID=265564 ORGANISM="Thalassiosira punctigera, Strain Tpunct2005C2" /NCGR_SAMPLE_ID=MMETSP1067 /ASSEMBLY_ACC=CAM_ASM_000444 /LENGTH=491 /DNA_ID=CAMNT_0013322145 /DNA_START=129 /DNA_END=1604 /DNA_ORIENTATION=+